MKHELPKLPYDLDALEPHLSSETLKVHYSKHHQGYVDKLNKGLADAPEARNSSLEQIIRKSSGDIFNNAAQVWNHTFYWNSMGPDGGGDPDRELAARLEEHFGSVDEFRDKLVAAGEGEFGSGWAWLVSDENDGLKVLSTTDAHNPLEDGMTPLLTVDVWEHAYYLDYRNERGDYLETFVKHLINWNFISTNLDQG